MANIASMEVKFGPLGIHLGASDVKILNQEKVGATWATGGK